MAGGGAPTTSGAITSINVTPLVDITLVLLIIFMVTAKLIVSHKVLPVDLPKATSGGDVQEVFSVVLSASGDTQVDGETLPDDDAILARARSAEGATPELRAVIKADGSVPHARVMHVLDLLKRAGVGKIGFGVVPVPASSATSSGER